jgi:hypothetical protein
LKAWYTKINAKFFFNELPQNVVVRWALPGEETDIASTTRTEGKYSYLILFNKEKVKTQSQKLSTMLHECVHVATGNRDDHGPLFAEWHLKLTERGAFKKGALLKNITLF